MPFQITLQTYRQLLGQINSFTAGPDQLVLCEDTIVLEATVDGDLFGHTFEWEQLSGTVVVLNNDDTLTPSFSNVDGSDKTFRFYLDRGTPKEQFDDITVFNKPISDAQFNKSDSTFRRFIGVDEVECSSINAVLETNVPPPITLQGDGPDPLNRLVLDWDLPPDLNYRPFLEELNLQIARQLPESYVHFTMNSFNGAIVVDEESSIEATLAGTLVTDVGKEGTALVFDGTTNKITFDELIDGPNPTEISLSCWVKKPQNNLPSGAGDVFFSHRDSSAGALITFMEVQGRLSVRAREVGGSSVNVFETTGTYDLNSDYNHIVFIFRANGNCEIWVNNVLQLSQLLTSTNDYTATLEEVGALSFPGITVPIRFTGNLDHYKLFTKGLSEIEIDQLYNEFTEAPRVQSEVHYTMDNLQSVVIPANNPLQADVHYTMDNISGVTLVDEEGLIDATLDGTVVTNPGKFENALTFDGTSTRITLNSVIANDPTELSVSCWTRKPNSNNVNEADVFFSHRETNSGPFVTFYNYLNNLTILLKESGGSIVQFDTPSPVDLDTPDFNHLVFIFRANGNCEAWMNNVQVLSQPYSSTNGHPSNREEIGSLFFPGITLPIRFTGELDHWKLFNRAITPAEINQLFLETPPITVDAVIDEEATTNATMINGPLPQTAGIDVQGLLFSSASLQRLEATPPQTTVEEMTISVWTDIVNPNASNIITSHNDNPSTTAGTPFLVSRVFQRRMELLVRGSGDTNLQILQGNINLQNNDGYHHMVFIFRRFGFCEFWFDGNLINREYVNLGPYTSSRLDIGAFTDGVGFFQYFDGKMDEFKLFDRALDKYEIQTLYNETTATFQINNFDRTVASYLQTDTQEYGGFLPYVSSIISENPISYWRFEEDSGSTLVDTISGTNNGTLINSPTLQSAELITEGNSIKFDGSSHVAQTSASFDFVQQSGVFTIEGWIKLNAFYEDKQNTICGTNLGEGISNHGFALYHENRSSESSPQSLRFLFSVGSGNSVLLTADNTLTDGLPHYVAITGDGSTLTMYIDGEVAASTSIVSLSGGSSCHAFDLANVYDCDLAAYRPNAGFKGALDEFAIYNKTLSADLIRDHYDSGLYEFFNVYRIESRFSINGDDYFTYSCEKDFSNLQIPPTCVGDDSLTTGFAKAESTTEITRFVNINMSESEDFDGFFKIGNTLTVTPFTNIALTNNTDQMSFARGESEINITRFDPTSL